MGKVMQSTNDAMNIAEIWCGDNGLVLNKQKTECVVFTTNRSNICVPDNFCHGNVIFVIEDTTKFLGLHLDSQLNWNKHIYELNKKLCSIIYSLNVLKHHVNLDILKIIYHANFRSVLSYGLIFWGGCGHAK
ncbi:hypothetical protein WA026_004849 [Henosepilachna vigintioctopunctata]|uniref:Uncharacterized protein n=1 Tax=Henosepilachna vigintioctopunctata TaxID=420089 RepID=A0AAW1UTQ6_9CUCU